MLLGRKAMTNLSSVKSLSCTWLFPTSWTAACQASLSITNSCSLLKLMSFELVMPYTCLNCNPGIVEGWGKTWERRYKLNWNQTLDLHKDMMTNISPSFIALCVNVSLLCLSHTHPPSVQNILQALLDHMLGDRQFTTILCVWSWLKP